MDSLVSTQWLADRLGQPGLVILDSSWFMPGTKRDAWKEYQDGHIPGAQFLDIEALSDHSDPAPHMLPGTGDFKTAMEQLGIGKDQAILVYDHSPIHTAARGWFMLRHFGASKVAILDGGLGKWISEGRPLESGEPPRWSARFDPVVRDDVVSKSELLEGTGLPWVDARGRLRFEGSEPEPRPGVKPGHAPGARNLPFGQLYRDDGTFRTAEELEQIIRAAGIDPLRPFVASCGSGITANSLIFAAHLLGNDQVRLYDGSWSEWGCDPATPKVSGPV